MTRSGGSHIRGALTSILSPQLIRARAARLGVVKRRRKIDVVALVYTLVLGSDRGAHRSLTSLRRAYEVATGTTIAASAFYDRFTTELAALLGQLTQHAFARLALSRNRLTRALGAFSKLLIADGSLLRLKDGLERDYPSVWTNHTKASAKLHIVANGATRTPEIIHLAPGSRHDVTLMTVDDDSRGTLHIFDLAYYQGKLFQRILDAGGHFLCRVKKDANFEIVGASRAQWLGRKHREVLRTMTGKSFEVEVDYAYRHIPERDWTWRHMRLRLIAIWNPAAKAHRLYLTSASTTALPLENVAPVYAMRWEIELLFRELKSQLRIEDLPSANKAVVEALIFASLITLALGRRLLEIHRSLHDRRRRRVLPAERWSTIVRSIMPALLDIAVGPPRLRRALERRLALFLGHEAPDPNRRRLLLRQRGEAGVLRYGRAAA